MGLSALAVIGPSFTTGGLRTGKLFVVPFTGLLDVEALAAFAVPRDSMVNAWADVWLKPLQREVP